MIRIGYEGLSWATRNNTWQSSWDVVRLADRPNVGLVIDTFHVLVKEYPSLLNPTISSPYPSQEEALSLLHASMSNLSETVPGSKIFLLQLADAAAIERMEFSDLGSTYRERLRSYARTRRLHPGEIGGWMPADVVLEAVQKTGYTGPWSLEVFHSRLEDPQREVPAREAGKGRESLKWLMEAERSGGEGAVVERGPPKVRETRAALPMTKWG